MNVCFVLLGLCAREVKLTQELVKDQSDSAWFALQLYGDCASVLSAKLKHSKMLCSWEQLFRSRAVQPAS
jgi:hypothetical protein